MVASLPLAGRLPRFSAEEWAARVQLAACYRIFAHLGWTELIYNHITVRLPGPETHFTVHADDGPRLVRNIGDRPAVILRSHGLLAWGDIVPRTFAILWLLNRACEVQVASMAMGAVIEVPEDVQAKCTRDSLQFSPTFGAGQDMFDALIRVVDRIDPSYRNWLRPSAAQRVRSRAPAKRATALFRRAISAAHRRTRQCVGTCMRPCARATTR